MCDLLWSDPKRGQEVDWCPNERGVSYTFAEEVVTDFLEKFDLDLICRAHQVMDDGYEFFADYGMLTIFSAPNYGGELDNSGAVLIVDSDLVCTLNVLRPYESEKKFLIGDSFFDEEYDDDTDVDSANDCIYACLLNMLILFNKEDTQRRGVLPCSAPGASGPGSARP